MNFFKTFIKNRYLQIKYSLFSGSLIAFTLIFFCLFKLGSYLLDIPMSYFLGLGNSVLESILSNNHLGNISTFICGVFLIWFFIMSIVNFLITPKEFFKEVIHFPSLFYTRFFSRPFTYKDLLENHKEIFSSLEKHPQAEYLIKNLSESLYNKKTVSDSIIISIHEHLNLHNVDEESLQTPENLIAEYSKNKNLPESEQKLQFFEKQSQ